MRESVCQNISYLQIDAVVADAVVANDDDVGELTALLDDSSEDEVKQQRKLVCHFLLVKINA